MARVKVDAVSKFGVKVDGSWIGFDKKFKPLDIEKNDLLEIVLNDAGYIISASKVGEFDRDLDYQRNILRGQCLKIAADFAIEKGWDLQKPECRKLLADVAVTLFAELQNVGYLQW